MIDPHTISRPYWLYGFLLGEEMREFLSNFIWSVIIKCLIVAAILLAGGLTDPKVTACSTPGDPIGGSGHHCKW